jgi:trehalose 6-phosphate synthase/phosphatase
LKVSQINGKHSSIGQVPVHLFFRSVTFEELCALYSLADAATVTPLIDGMNLVAKEYIFCQKEKSGALILSEFAGAAQELCQAYVVNPYNIRQISETIKQALDADEEEKRKRLLPMKKRVTKYNASFWAESFLNALTTRCQKVPCAAQPPGLSPETINRIRSARRGALFLDYDGTLAEFKRMPENASPSGEVEEILFSLSRQKQFDVYIISERKREEMDIWFSNFGLNLIAEQGFCYKEKNSDDWVFITPKTNLSWKDNVRDFLKLFTGMTPGSFLEEKTASLVWHYRNSDPDLGSWKAHQLVSELQDMLSNLPVVIHHGKKNVVIASVHANKGAVVSHILSLKNYDTVLCVGDDETDESMFRLSDPKNYRSKGWCRKGYRS